MALTDQSTYQVMGENEYCRLHQIPCKPCGQLFKANEGTTKMWDMTRTGGQGYVFYHYPTCPPPSKVAPSSNALAPGRNYNAERGWE